MIKARSKSKILTVKVATKLEGRGHASNTFCNLSIGRVFCDSFEDMQTCHPCAKKLAEAG